MAIKASEVNKLRQQTGAGMMDCKNALVETNGDFEAAVDVLRKKGQKIAAKRGGNDAKEGVIIAQSSNDSTAGVIVTLNCETDFVAKTEGYSELAHNLAMQIAATNPLAIRREDIADTVVEHEKSIFSDQAKESGKPENIIEKMVEGRMDKFYAESCLLEQSFIKDPDKKVGDLLTQAVSTLGENIVVSRFTRFAIGEESSNGQPH